MRHALVIGIDTYSGFGAGSQLFGAVRDAQTMAELLRARFAFSVTELLEEQATREGILDALTGLKERVRRDDHAVLFFSGHGSQIRDRENDEGDGLDETLVPFDSGRRPAPNREISDDEIRHWAAGILDVTPNLVLIFDCCHSATLHRPFGRVRAVPPDLRPVEELPPSPVLLQRDVETGPQPLLLAACRDDEQAIELAPPSVEKHRGAFSLQLENALREAVSSDSWQTVFERVKEAMRTASPDQHPQLSGDGLDVSVFGGARQRVDERPVSQKLLELARSLQPVDLEMKLYRSRRGAWLPARDAAFFEGDRLRVDIRHRHERRVFVYLFDVGLTGKVSLLFPDHEGQESLDPGVLLTIGARPGDTMTLKLPKDFPSDESAGTGHFVLLVSERRLSTGGLVAGGLDGVGSEGISGGIVRAYRLSRA